MVSFANCFALAVKGKIEFDRKIQAVAFPQCYLHFVGEHSCTAAVGKLLFSH